MKTARSAIGLLALASLALVAPNAHAETGPASYRAVATTTLQLDFNEPRGSTVALDASGLGHNGAIGSHIRLSGTSANFDRHEPGAGIYYGADHLVVVPDAADGSIDPGAGNFTVEVRYKTSAKFGNVIQKGQSATVGGQVKLQQPKGVMSCMFKSPNGRATVSSKTALNDGQWHTVRCERTPTMVTMYVDGVYRNRIRNATSTIDNKIAWTIGGKLNCDTSDPTTGADSCDYFPGDIDYVTLTKG